MSKIDEKEAGHRTSVTVLVNGKPVTFHKIKVTGEEIKATASEQGVKIKPDYILKEVITDNKKKRILDADEVHLITNIEFTAKKRKVEIFVNEQVVKIAAPVASGLRIKTLAINQGVLIQANFVLQEELSNGTSRIIGDSDRVHIHEHMRFTAIAPDDNS